MKPKISVIVCTYNGEKLIENCLNSILSQAYRNFEVLCIDGGSSDRTKEIIKSYMKKERRIRLIHNKNKLPEGKGNGKWLGFKKAKGEIFGIIDQDNVLQRKDFFSLVVNLIKEKNLAGILGGVKHDLSDSQIVRYVALAGTDAFFAYRSIDFIRNIGASGMLKSANGSIEKASLQLDNMAITGGNCFFYSKENLEKVGGYTRDIDTIRRLVASGKNKLFIINGSTKHYAEKNIASLIRKKFAWAKKYFVQEKEDSFNYLPQTKKEFFAFSKNLVFNLLILPNFVYSVRLYSCSKDPVSFLFPFIAFTNTIAYGLNFLARLFY